MPNINKLIENIRLGQKEIEEVSTAKDNLVRSIKNKANVGLIPAPKEIFLTGSYSRGTKISPLDDVDIFYVVGYAAMPTIGNHHAITDCNFYFNESFLDTDRNISSNKLLYLMKKEIEKESIYSRSEISKNNEAVNVYLSSYEAGFDIVPAFWIAGGNYYLIPNGGNSTKWKRSNPKIDEENINRINEKHSRLAKNIIRIVKYWFRKKKITSPRSYHIESLIYHVFDISDPIFSYDQGLKFLFSNINYCNYLSKCPDPTGISESISSDLQFEDIQKIEYEAKLALDYIEIGEEEFVKYVEPGF